MPDTIDPNCKLSSLESDFALLWVTLYPDIDLHNEHRFCQERKYRLDFAHLPSKTGIEIQGGIWGKGGHSTARGIMRDCEKAILAASHGWHILFLTEQQIRDPDSLAIVARVIQLKS